MDFKEVIQKIKNEYNVVDYIKINGVNLESSGYNQWKGLCPFHNEKTPSFTVSEDFQSYKCFGCGESGDILSFAQHTHTISFYEAVKMLAEEKDIEIGEIISDEVSYNINAIRQVVLDASTFFRANYDKLDETHPAKQQIINRGLDPENKIYGYSLEAPNELYKFLSKKGHTDDNIRDSQLVVFFEDEPGRAPWDFFHGRLMITLADYLDRPISFTSRKIYKDDKMAGKYVNGKESPVFYKKNNLFGSNVAKTKARSMEEIYVVEGQFDQISMVEKGVENVVATSGTAFTNEHANLLLRMVGNSGRIVFIMDGDDAGIKAAIKVFTGSKSLHSNAHAVLLEDGKDPCDYIVDGGIEALQLEIDKAVPLHDFVISSVLRKMDNTVTISNRQSFVSEIAKFAKYSDDNFVIDSMLNKTSVISSISIQNVRDIYNKTKVDKVYKKQEETLKVQKLNPDIKLNKNSEADLCMFSSLALLVRMPDELIKETPKEINDKFKSFLRELGIRYSAIKKSDGNWRFIAEDYTDSDFAKTLQNKTYLEDPKDDINSTISQYKYLFNRANELYKKEFESIERAKALSSIVDSTDPVEIAKVLTLYREFNSKT